ncbi:MAG: ABC transporter family substrate-binding protein [Mycobacteriaceae bacterium]|nr:ABC transporter family substrate-binding protein [Mycobacteriaceae bacterium]
MRAALRVVAVVVVAAGALAGCVADPEPADFDSGVAWDVNPQPAEKVRDGGDMVIGVGAFPSNFNLLHNDGNVYDTQRIVEPTMPRPYVSDAAGNISVNRNFFTDIRITGVDPQRVTFTINPRAVWSDGSPITWEDLASQANALSGRDSRFQIAATNGFERVARVERGADEREAVLVFAQPYGDWMNLYDPVYPKAVTASPEAFNNADREQLSISAGPYRMSRIDRVANRVTLERNPRWWGARPKLDHITYTVIDGAAAVPAMLNREIDATFDNLYNVNDAAMAHSSPDIAVRIAPDPSTSFVTFNGAPGAILADARLRVALAKAIDRRTIVKALQNGLVKDPKPLANHIFLQHQTGYRDNAQALDYDPAAARRELDALGWRLHGEVREKQGRRLEITDALVDIPNGVSAAKIIRANLAAVGVRVNIRPYRYTGFFAEVIHPGRFDIAQHGWVHTQFPLGALTQIYALDPNNLQGNYGHVGSAEINALIDRTVSELDPAKSRRLANEVDRKVSEIGFSIPMYELAGAIPVRTNVANFGAFGLATPDYTVLGFLK